MSDADEAELFRLCGLLRQIDERAGLSPVEQEALKKAGLALHRVFLGGSRAELEHTFHKLDLPPDEEQLARLRAMDIDPDHP